jgi:hypothetical protein
MSTNIISFSTATTTTTTLLDQNNSYILYLDNVITIIGFFYYTIFGIVGIALNVIGIIGFSRKSFADLSRNAICQQGFFNIVIAVYNNVCIVLVCLNNIPFYFGQNPFLWSTFACILLNYLEIGLLSFLFNLFL